MKMSSKYDRSIIAPDMEQRLPGRGLVLSTSPSVHTDGSSYGDMPSSADAALLGTSEY